MTTAERDTQRMKALNYGNVVRMKCGDFKRQVAQLDQDEAVACVIDLLMIAEDQMEHAMTVRQLLRSIPYVHDSKVQVLLRRAEILSGDKRIRDLTVRQRLVLAKLLRDRAWSVYPYDV